MIKISPLGSFYLHVACHSRPCPLEAHVLRAAWTPASHLFLLSHRGCLELKGWPWGRDGAAHPLQPLHHLLLLSQQLGSSLSIPYPNLSGPGWAAILDLMCMTTTKMHLGNRKLLFFFPNGNLGPRDKKKSRKIVCDITKLSIPKIWKMCVCICIYIYI